MPRLLCFAALARVLAPGLVRQRCGGVWRGAGSGGRKACELVQALRGPELQQRC